MHEFRHAVGVDPLVGQPVKALMPWHPVSERNMIGTDGVTAHELTIEGLQVTLLAAPDQLLVRRPSRGTRPPVLAVLGGGERRNQA